MKQEPLAPMDFGDEALCKVKGHLNKLKTRMIDVYRAIDESGDGVVTTDEFRHGLNRLGISCSDEEFEAIIVGVDKDMSGDVSTKEFHKALKLAERKARAEGRDAEVDTFWANSSHSDFGLSTSFDWSQRSIRTDGFDGLRSPLSTGSSWYAASGGPMHAVQAAKIHCGSLQDSSVSRQRLFDGVATLTLPPVLASPKLPLHKTVHRRMVVEGRFCREPVTLPADELHLTRDVCCTAGKALRDLAIKGRVRQFQSSPMMQSTVDSVVFGRDMDFSGEDKFDEEFTAMFEGSAGIPSWHYGR